MGVSAHHLEHDAASSDERCMLRQMCFLSNDPLRSCETLPVASTSAGYVELMLDNGFLMPVA